MPSSRLFRLAAAILLLLLALNAFGLFPKGGNEAAPNGTPYVLYSDFLHDIDQNNVTSIAQVAGSPAVMGRLKSGATIYTYAPEGNDLIHAAQEHNVSVDIRPPAEQSGSGWFGQMLFALLPTFVLVALLWWLQKRQMGDLRAMGGGMGRDFRSGRTREVMRPEQNPHRLKDVAGCEDAKREVAEIIDFLKNPADYQRVGARSPKGVLMSGPPGTGKTLLAKAIAGEAGVPFLSASGSDFMEMFVGVGASRVRALFDEAKKNAPAIVFIDEIDSVARTRSSNAWGGGSNEHEQTLNALLVEMDGFTPSTNVVVIAATNRSDVLDPAVLRPGRFDREVGLPLPDRAGRLAILRTHAAKVPLASNVDLDAIARGTPGFSGADLANLINEGAILAARAKSVLVSRAHLDAARDKVLMGVQSSPLTNAHERKVVAYHEAGHALVAHFLPLADPVHKISIVPRGRALGVTMQLPQEDSYNHSRDRLMTDLAVMMGGRAAEEVALHSITVGASNDFHRATVLARRMVTSWGMDADLGPVSLDGERGSEWSQTNIWSETLKVQADTKVQDLLKERYGTATALLNHHRAHLDAVAQALLERETLDADEFEAIVGPGERPAAAFETVPAMEQVEAPSGDRVPPPLSPPAPAAVPL